jgi:hypothetical protein
VSLQCIGPLSMHVEAYANASHQNYKSGAVSKLAHGLGKAEGGKCWGGSESVEGLQEYSMKLINRSNLKMRSTNTTYP